MSDYDDDFDADQGEDQNDEPQPDRNPLRAELKKAQRDLKASRAEAEAGKTATRELAFIRAGIDLKAPGAKSFVKAYDGDLTAEAITAAAVEDGIVTPEEPDPVTPQEREAHQRIADQGSGGRPPGSHDIDSAIAEAEQAGNHLRAITLKQQKAHLAKR